MKKSTGVTVFFITMTIILGLGCLSALIKNLMLESECSGLEKSIKNGDSVQSCMQSTKAFFMELADKELFIDDEELLQDEYWSEYWGAYKTKPFMTVSMLSGIDNEYGTDFLSWFIDEGKEFLLVDESKVEVVTDALSKDPARHKFAVWLCKKATSLLQPTSETSPMPQPEPQPMASAAEPLSRPESESQNPNTSSSAETNF